ncbi:glycosyltransferase [Herbivorax sp. ANBcel31]|uniref:glycosyltransferase n=1 Tax=Herbivorax sp. ANBcel31 TaxID=3069754 RepID=UPI0027B40346|nr:nucleotide disphospho-sugar-binding domain-containing protein [Herbivorax sp. ANBcel31]MDQ2086149.1 glycosyltransferase [Herbivorax sp. ANBcel31]
MKILIAPMAVPVEARGPFSRAKKIAAESLERGHEVAFCAAEDINYSPIKSVKNYFVPVPSVFGLPKILGKSLIRSAQKLGIQKKKNVSSYEEVMHIFGIICEDYFRKDVRCIREAIRDFNPDVVYAEFRIAAIVAAKLENKKVATSFSYPVQEEYANNPEYSKGVNRFLQDNNLPNVRSTLEIFRWANLKIVPSSYELEPIEDREVKFVGALNSYDIEKAHYNFGKRNKIVVYMGNGAISPRKQINEMKKGFLNSQYDVYIASNQIKNISEENIIVRDKFEFDKLLPEAIAFINHGGQNSIMDGVVYGAPQIICPGNVFERRYNARSIEKLEAGKLISDKDFKAIKIKDFVNELKSNKKYIENAINVGEKLKNLGGIKKVISELESI